MMNNDQSIMGDKEVIIEGGYKVIEVNISNITDNLYAVCTPIEMD
ncbi:hypothetical protein [Oceanobacillus chungangensis]|nr:hypothetical protein [Oceanobacillus chungangensis]